MPARAAVGCTGDETGERAFAVHWVVRGVRRHACRAMVVAGLCASPSVATAGIFQCERDDKMSIEMCEAANATPQTRRQNSARPASAPKAAVTTRTAPAAATAAPAGSNTPPLSGKRPWVDPHRDAKFLRARIERSLAHRTQNTAKWRGAAPSCRELIEQIASEQPGLHSLRAERRALARERMRRLSTSFEERGC